MPNLESQPQAEQVKKDPIDLIDDQPKPQNSPAKIATVAEFTPPPPQNLRPAEFATPAKIATVKEEESENTPAIFATVKGFLKLPNSVLDELPAILDTNEQLMYIQLYRLSHGFGKDICLVTLDKLGKRTGIAERTVQKTLTALENKSLITKVGYNFGGKGPKGIQIRVVNFATPANIATVVENATPANSADIKEFKRKLIKECSELVPIIKQIYPEATIGDIADEIKRIFANKGMQFDYKIFNDNLTQIMNYNKHIKTT